MTWDGFVFSQILVPQQLLSSTFPKGSFFEFSCRVILDVELPIHRPEKSNHHNIIIMSFSSKDAESESVLSQDPQLIYITLLKSEQHLTVEVRSQSCLYRSTLQKYLEYLSTREGGYISKVTWVWNGSFLLSLHTHTHTHKHTHCTYTQDFVLLHLRGSTPSSENH